MTLFTTPIFSPILDIYLFSIISTIILKLLEKYFFKIKLNEEEKNKFKTLKKELKEYTKSKDIQNTQKTQKKLFEMQISQMKKRFSLKMILFRIIPYSAFLGFMRTHYKEFGNILSFFGMNFAWLGTFIIFSIINSIIISYFKKLYFKFKKKKENGKIEVE